MIRKIVLGTAIMLASLGGTAGASAAPAHAAAAPAHVATATLTSAAVPDANDCDLPTQADPGSKYIASYQSCYLCLFWANYYNTFDPFNLYYCTYNPSNDLNDLHSDPI